MRRIVARLLLGLWILAVSAAAEPNGPPATSAVGVSVSYRLPSEGPAPKTYLVTLAIVDPQDPDWIVSQFVRGEPRVVTAENDGRFTDLWDGLDENLMPVPPGTYGVKGIFMPAATWRVDGEAHAITPRFVAGASSWMPSPEQWNVPEPFGGDPCGAPLGDVDVGPDGVGVFYYVYLENGLNNPMFDLKRPVGLGQFLRAFPSGGAGGGTSTCTDGESVWSFSTDGGPKYVYRADGKPFGTGRANRSDVYRPEGWVKAMACCREAGKSYVYVAQGGKILEIQDWPRYVESDEEPVDLISVHDGETGRVLAEMPLEGPLGIAARGGRLYAVHGSTARGFQVSARTLRNGLPQGPWQPLFDVPAGTRPDDIEVDGRSRIYLSDARANHVYQFDPSGRKTHTYGRLDSQQPGGYDRLTLMAPGKLATWTDAEGNDRVIIVERAGPNRVSEWSADGRLLREFLPLQTKANDGYAVDPERPEHVYLAGHEGWLTRFRVDYDRGTWSIDAVWPNVGNDPVAPGCDHPQFIRIGGRCYLACGRGNSNVYRLDGERWLLSAAIIRQRQGNDWNHFLFRDANGDGVVQEEEYRDSPLQMPGWLLRYHGNQWLADLSLVAPNQAGPDVWRLAPAGFDRHGNPIFTPWQKLLTDPVFTARAEGRVDAIHGGNELDTLFSSDWAMVDGAMQQDFYVVARGGHSFSANEGAQIKVSRYVPDDQGGYRLKWRTGRTALEGVAKRGEMYGAIHIWKPIGGLLSVVDQSRCGVVLLTEDGLYVDTIFPDPRRFPPTVAGIYPLPGEFFAGLVYSNCNDGKIYFGMGKVTPLIFAAEGWSLKENPVRELTGLPREVTLRAAQIASPPEIALTVRGGAGVAKLARFSPALGGAALDGSLSGWESCEPVQFQADEQQSVEVRGMYDPEHLYLRWHARLPAAAEPKPLPSIERIFSHERLADTLSFYLQGDPGAKPGGSTSGRAGDVRFVFSLVRDGATVRPLVVAMYPVWKGPPQAHPVTYRTPVGSAEFEHVAPVGDAELHYVLDEDGRGFVLAASLPRSAVPGLPLLGSNVRTMANFAATFGGHSKFWWSNADGSASRETYDEPTEARLYPGSWAPLTFQGLEHGVVVRHWQLCGPFGGPGAEKFRYDLSGRMPGTKRDWKQAGREFCQAATYPPDGGTVDLQAVFRGDLVRGYWDDPGGVRWRRATVADLDTRVVCGSAAQVWYGATWIHVPKDLQIDLCFQGHPQTYLRWLLNGREVLEGEIPGEELLRSTTKTLVLRNGWNQVMFRGYCVGYPKFRAGLVLNAPVERLWQLRLSPTPDQKQRSVR